MNSQSEMRLQLPFPIIVNIILVTQLVLSHFILVLFVHESIFNLICSIHPLSQDGVSDAQADTEKGYADAKAKSVRSGQIAGKIMQSRVEIQQQTSVSDNSWIPFTHTYKRQTW